MAETRSRASLRESGGSSRNKRQGSPRALSRAYRSLALIFLNTCLLLLVANVALFVAFRLLDSRRQQPHRAARSPESLSRHGAVHPGLERQQIRQLWEETYLASSGFVYEPYTQFRIQGFAGTYVTVDERGFRRHEGIGPWPPDPAALNILLYGGSTTFGYGVVDDQTIAAHLQSYLTERGSGVVGEAPGRPIRVYNFGRAGYFSTQERLLFERHLTDGVVPDVALFIDGLNDTRILANRPIFSDRLRRQFEVRDVSLAAVLARLPMMRLARAVTGRSSTRPSPVEAPWVESEVSERMTAEYLSNKRMIEAVAASYEVDARFVWQPVSVFNYDRRHHLFAESKELPQVQAGYHHMAALVGAGRLGENFLWLANMQVGLGEPLYVDPAHYSGPMNRRIATRIGNWLVERAAAQGVSP